MNNKTSIAYDSLRNLLSELINEENLINNRTLYIERYARARNYSKTLFQILINTLQKNVTRPYTTEPVMTNASQIRSFRKEERL